MDSRNRGRRRIIGAISFGLGEAAAQGAEAGRIAATAARVSSIISRLVETAGAVGDATESVATKIAEILSKLKTILRLGTEHAEVTGATADEEVSALKRLEQGCFLPGTMVLTQVGLQPIEQVTVGDLVVTTDPHTGVQELRPVRATTTHTAFGVIDIKAAGTRISCTSEHPFWVHAQGWTKAADLTAGDVLLDAEFQPRPVDAVTSRSGTYTVHNLEVDDLHAYHVSCAKILVHNKAMRIRPENPTLRDAKWLKKNGIDPHTVKEILPGPVSRFDIYVDRNGNVWGVAKGANPNDGEFLGNLEDFK